MGEDAIARYEELPGGIGACTLALRQELELSQEARCPVVFYATRDGALPAGSGFDAWAVRGTGESGGMTGFRMEGAGRALDGDDAHPAAAVGVELVVVAEGGDEDAVARSRVDEELALRRAYDPAVEREIDHGGHPTRDPWCQTQDACDEPVTSSRYRAMACSDVSPKYERSAETARNGGASTKPADAL